MRWKLGDCHKPELLWEKNVVYTVYEDTQCCPTLLEEALPSSVGQYKSSFKLFNGKMTAKAVDVPTATRSDVTTAN